MGSLIPLQPMFTCCYRDDYSVDIYNCVEVIVSDDSRGKRSWFRGWEAFENSVPLDTVKHFWWQQGWKDAQEHYQKLWLQQANYEEWLELQNYELLDK